MKKSLLGIGAAGVAMALLSACSSTSGGGLPLAEQVKIAEEVVANAKGMENHNKLPEKYLLPNAGLEQTRVIYISWAGTAADMVLVRFGEADIISVIRDSTDTSNLKLWEALRNADADAEKAKAAGEELGKFIAQSYSKNKTTSKFEDKQVYDAVVGKMAQEDYIEYKKQLKEDPSKESDYKGQTTWLNTGKANIAKLAAAERKIKEDAEKRLAKAEEDAAETNRKIGLTVKYYGAKAAFILADGQAKKESNPFVKKGYEVAAKKLADEMAQIEKDFPDVVKVFDMPPVKTGSVEELKATAEAINKELEPWAYALDILTKRIDAYTKVKAWAAEAQKTLDEVSGEK